MKTILFATIFAIATVSALPSKIPHPYIPPGPNDLRSPCPALNALANQGYLARNGTDWKAEEVIQVLSDVYNIDPSLGNEFVWAAVFLVGQPLTQSFSLGDLSGLKELEEGAGLSRHNRIEHDASLTRLDAYYGDNHDFNAGLYAELKGIASKLNGGNFNTEVMSLHRLNRYWDSQINNPTFKFGPLQWLFAYGESALALNALGGHQGKASAANFDSFFAREKIPARFIKNPIALTSANLLPTILEIYNKNPVPIQGVGNIPQDMDSVKCFLINALHAAFPKTADDFLKFIKTKPNISLPPAC